MYRMRESWTDERMDDFRDEVNRRFDEVAKKFDEVDKKFDKVDKRFDNVDHELHRVNDRLDALNRTLLQIGGGMIATLIAGIFAVVVTQL